MKVCQQTRNSIRFMTKADLDVVLSWRNSREVRENMYTQHKITPEEHYDWFVSSKNNPKRHLMIVEKDSIPFGVVNIIENAEGNIAEWGFYTAPNSEKGSGSLLAQLALKYAFTKLKIHKVCGQALAKNEKSIRFHHRQGFTEEGKLREQYFDGIQYHSVICFGLLKKEWLLKTED